MRVLVTIAVQDEDGEDLDFVSGSAGTPEEAVELALSQLDIPDDPG